MYDLATLPASHNLILEFHSLHKPISAVCHGPAALLNITNPTTGLPLIHSLPVTGFSNAEEEDMGLMQYMPFPLETKLAEASGKYEKAAANYGEKVVVATFPEGGLLITGQNPASAGGVGKAILKALEGKEPKGVEKSGLKGVLQKGLDKITGH
jgi:putative intracellular protease/amidase